MKTVSMKPVVQKPRKDGFWAVYIRFTLDGRCQFWKTSKVVSSQNVKSKSEITDSYVLSFCSSLILQWMEKLNHVDYSAWSLKDIVEYVTNDDSQVSFSSYARTYIEKIDKPRTAKNYILALKHLEKYFYSFSVDIFFIFHYISVFCFDDRIMKKGTRVNISRALF